MEEDKPFEIITTEEEDKLEKLFKAVETKPIVVAIAPDCCEGVFVPNYLFRAVKTKPSVEAVETKPIVVAIAPDCCEGVFVPNYQDKARELGEAVKKGKVEFFYMQTCHVDREVVGVLPTYGVELKCYDALKECGTVEELEGLLIGEVKDQLTEKLRRAFRGVYLLELVPEDTKVETLKFIREQLDRPNFIEGQEEIAFQTYRKAIRGGFRNDQAHLVGCDFAEARKAIHHIKEVFAKYKQK